MRFYSFILIFLLAGVASGEQVSEISPDAKSVAEQVRARYPEEPVTIRGTLSVRKRRGVVEKELRYSMRASWRNNGVDLQCFLNDMLGRETGEFHAVLRDRQFKVLKIKGDEILGERGNIKGTALDLFDVAMPFLWWDEVKMIGVERSRGRECYIVDFTDPAGGDINRVRAWIDKSLLIVLKAESFGKDGKRVKTILVKSFKSVDDQWMIKDLEVAGESSSERTLVTVDEIKVGAEEQQESGG